MNQDHMEDIDLKMFKRVSELLKYLAHESGKVAYTGKCPFCGQKLTDERLKAFKVRLGRMQFLFRVYEETDSQKAYEFLHELFAQPQGRDIPEREEDFPDWWSKLANELYIDEAKTRQK